MYMHRILEEKNLPPDLDASQVPIPEKHFPDPSRWNLPRVPLIWTGVHNQKDCLVYPDAHPSCPQGKIEDLDPWGAGCVVEPSSTGSGASKRDAGGGAPVCVMRPPPPDNSGNPNDHGS